MENTTILTIIIALAIIIALILIMRNYKDLIPDTPAINLPGLDNVKQMFSDDEQEVEAE